MRKKGDTLRELEGGNGVCDQDTLYTCLTFLNNRKVENGLVRSLVRCWTQIVSALSDLKFLLTLSSPRLRIWDTESSWPLVYALALSHCQGRRGLRSKLGTCWGENERTLSSVICTHIPRSASSWSQLLQSFKAVLSLWAWVIPLKFVRVR